mgnify:CR=1 FL=1
MIYLSPTEISDLINKGESIHILDVRENYEHEQCNISCQHIPMAEIINHIDSLKNIDKLALICRSGRRAEAIANWLEQEHHLSNIIIVEGGILNWKEQIDPNLNIE